MVRVKKIGRYEVEEYEKPFPLDNEKEVEKWLGDKEKEEKYDKRFRRLVEDCRRILTKEKEDLLTAYWMVGDAISSFIASVPPEERTETYNRTRSAVFKRIRERLDDLKGTSEWYIDMMVRFREYEPTLSSIDHTITWSLYWELMGFDESLYKVYKERVAARSMGKSDLRWFLKVKAVSSALLSQKEDRLSGEQIAGIVEPNVAGHTALLFAVLDTLVTLDALHRDQNLFVLTPGGRSVLTQLLEETKTADLNGQVMRAARTASARELTLE